MSQRAGGVGERRGSRQEYPEDRFDAVARSGRVGAHRVTARPRYTWQYIIAGLLGFALLTTVGVLVAHNVGSSGKLPSLSQGPSAGAATKTPDAELDPEATIAVLNGTPIPNLAAALDGIISSEKWGKVLLSGSASSTDVKISAVFYRDEADAAAAAGLAAELGGLYAYPTTDYKQYDSRLIVLLGADYAGPGIEEAAAMTAEKANEGGEDSLSVDSGDESATDPATDPATGWAIDPATGFPIDPDTGLPQDPATGLPVQPVDPSAP